jgi:hypothetical protein
MGRVEEKIKKRLHEVERERVHFVKLEELHELLERLEPTQASGESTVKGYRVETSYKTMSHAGKESVSQVIAQAIRRIKSGER